MRLAQGGGFLAVAACEIGELGGQGAYHAGGKVLAGEGGGSGLLPGRLRGAVVLDPGADHGVAVEEVQGDPGAGGRPRKVTGSPALIIAVSAASARAVAAAVRAAVAFCRLGRLPGMTAFLAGDRGVGAGRDAGAADSAGLAVRGCFRPGIQGGDDGAEGGGFALPSLQPHFLTNPAYAGAFVFGRTRTEKRLLRPDRQVNSPQHRVLQLAGAIDLPGTAQLDQREVTVMAGSARWSAVFAMTLSPSRACRQGS